MKSSSPIFFTALALIVSCGGSGGNGNNNNGGSANYPQQLDGEFEVSDSLLSSCGDNITFNYDSSSYSWQRFCVSGSVAQSQYEEGVYSASLDKINFISSRSSCDENALRNATYDYDLSDDRTDLLIKADRELNFARIGHSSSQINGKSIVYGCYDSSGQFQSNDSFSR